VDQGGRGREQRNLLLSDPTTNFPNKQGRDPRPQSDEKLAGDWGGATVPKLQLSIYAWGVFVVSNGEKLALEQDFDFRNLLEAKPVNNINSRDLRRGRTVSQNRTTKTAFHVFQQTAKTQGIRTWEMGRKKPLSELG